jgi:hypothetical protein
MDNEGLTAHIRENEERLLQPEYRSSAADLDRLLADDFVEIGASGRTWTKHQIIADLTTSDETLDVSLVATDFRMRVLADGLVLATYRCVRSTSGGGDTFSWRSSIWRNTGTMWHMVFHQGTPSAPDRTNSSHDVDRDSTR